MNEKSSAFNSYEFSTRKLHELAAERDQTEKRLDAARAVSAGLTTRQSNYLKAAAGAHAVAVQAASNFSAAKAATQSADQVWTPALKAKAQAEAVRDQVRPLFQLVHRTAELLVIAMVSVDQLAERVAERRGKNEPISPLMVSGAAQTKIAATNALNALNAAVQQTIVAVNAVEEAAIATAALPEAVQRLQNQLIRQKMRARVILPPGAPAPGIDEIPELATIGTLAKHTINDEPSILEVFGGLALITRDIAETQQDAANDATLQLEQANAELNAATTATKRAQAAYAAAEAAVA